MVILIDWEDKTQLKSSNINTFDNIGIYFTDYFFFQLNNEAKTNQNCGQLFTTKLTCHYFSTFLVFFEDCN